MKPYVRSYVKPYVRSCAKPYVCTYAPACERTPASHPRTEPKAVRA